MFNLKIKAETESFATEEYGTFGWPIKYFDKAQNLNEKYNYATINLRIDDNTKPILFLENTDLLGQNNNSAFIDENTLLNGTAIDWSKDITLKFPNTGTGVKDNIPYYIKLQYFRQIDTDTTNFNGIFASIDTPNLGDIDNKFQQVSNDHYSFIEGVLPNGSSFSGVAVAGANFDSNRVVFHTRMQFPKKTTGEFYANTTAEINDGFSLEGNFNQMSFLKKDIYSYAQSIQKNENSELIKILDVAVYNEFPGRKEDLYILGLMQSELSALRNVAGLSNHHARYIGFEDVSPYPAEDINGIPYKKYKLNVQGLDDSGLAAVAYPSSDIFVFTNRGSVFSSKDFSDAEPNKEDNIECIYYTRDGYYLGGDAISNKVYIVTQQEYDTAKQSEKWFIINQEKNLLKENNKNITNFEFSNDAYLVFHEASLTGNEYTALWIAHTVKNALYSKKYKRNAKTFNQLIKTGYSSAKSTDKQKNIPENNLSINQIYARFAVIDILKNGSDPTNKSYFWDGLDLLTRKGELDHPKFKQYKSVKILSEHLKAAVDFWSISKNKNKVSPNAVINSIFKSECSLKNVADGTILYDQDAFVGARTDSQNNPKVWEHLISTGFQSGTMFWTTYKS